MHYTNNVPLYLLIILLLCIVDDLLTPKVEVVELKKILASLDRVAAYSEHSRVSFFDYLKIS